MSYIQFMEALGNNFIIVDSVTQDLSFSKNSIPKFVDKEDFLEFDQVLVIEPPEKEIADFENLTPSPLLLSYFSKSSFSGLYLLIPPL